MLYANTKRKYQQLILWSVGDSKLASYSEDVKPVFNAPVTVIYKFKGLVKVNRSVQVDFV